MLRSTMAGGRHDMALDIRLDLPFDLCVGVVEITIQNQ